ncbi:MAG: ATP-binding protein [Fidelibacterota bacterium]
MLSFLEGLHKTTARILALFILAVGLPSLILGYLAFRGIRNDRARSEQELLELHERAVQTIVDVVENEIRLIELFIDRLYQRGAPVLESDFLVVAEQLKHSSPLVGEPFIVQGAQVAYPLFTRVFTGNRTSLPLDRAGFFPEKIEGTAQAENLEFQSDQYGEAAGAYEKALSGVTDDQARVRILFALARNQRRSGNKKAAGRTYERIVRNYQGTSIGGGMPADLAARLELCKLSLMDTTGDGAEKAVRLLTDLSAGKWSLHKSQFAFAVEEVDNIWSRLVAKPQSSLPEHSVRFQALQQEMNTRIAYNEKLLLFEEGLLGYMADSQEPNRRFSVKTGPYSFPVMAIPAPEGHPHGPKVIGTLINNGDELLAFRSIFAKVALPVNSLLQVTNQGGNVIDGSSVPEKARKTVEARFPGDFPPWTITLYQRDPELFQELLSSRKRIYVFVLVLAAGVLVFGSLFAVRMMGREVDLAKLKSDFVSTVSHELRSPLTSIRQLSEMLQAGRIPSEKRRQQYYDTIVEQSEQLSLRVENILDFARMDERKKRLQLEEVDVGQFLRELVERVQHQVQHKGFTIQTNVGDQLPLAKVDRDAMAQVLINLMDNAIKYSGRSRDIEISAREDSGHLRIDVRDHGIGIGKEEMKKVFDRFYRGTRNGKRPTRGTGLGLTLVKRIVEGHHGSVQVKSEPGRGSTFSVKLPLESGKDTGDATNSHH